jgi:hypothetical protein
MLCEKGLNLLHDFLDLGVRHDGVNPFTLGICQEIKPDRYGNEPLILWVVKWIGPLNESSV